MARARRSCLHRWYARNQVPTVTGKAHLLQTTAKSEWIASMGFPSERVTGMVVASVVVHGTSIEFTGIRVAHGRIRFDAGRRRKDERNDRERAGRVTGGIQAHSRGQGRIDFGRTGSG